MDSKHFNSAYGRRCHAVIRCRACGRPHEFSGTLTRGPLFGDVDLDGRVFAFSDVISVEPETLLVVATGPAMPRSLLPYAWLLWALLAALQVLARR